MALPARQLHLETDDQQELHEVVTLHHPDGWAEVAPGPGSLRTVTAVLVPGYPSRCDRHTIATRYPLSLIRAILAVKGPDFLCDEIAREEAPDGVEGTLRHQLLAYVTPAAARGHTVIDFGCGSGASTVVLDRMYPEAARIVGIDFNPAYLDIAVARRDFRGATRVDIRQQPTPSELPTGLPLADLIVLNAVVEHMLPEERRLVLPRVWAQLRIGGKLFITDTPHRWFPKEAHTTNLWLLNYQSAKQARARTIRSRRTGLTDWHDMLRAGIRGSTEREIRSCLTGGMPARARLLRPSVEGVTTRADLWHQGLTRGRRRLLKWIAREALDLGERLTGSLLTQNITMCVEKLG